MGKSKKWLNLEPLYVLHLFLAVLWILLAHYVGGFVGIESITGTMALYLVNAVWYFLWLYVFDVTFHYWVGGD